MAFYNNRIITCFVNLSKVDTLICTLKLKHSTNQYNVFLLMITILLPVLRRKKKNLVMTQALFIIYYYSIKTCTLNKWCIYIQQNMELQFHLS